MNELIKVSTNSQGEKVVNARELHEFLIKDAKGGQKGKQFNHWIVEKLDHLDAIINEEYIVINYDLYGNIIPVNKNGQSDNQLVRVHKTDYILKIDLAKQIAMVQNNDKGKQARQYFIQCEKTLKEVTKPIDTLDFLEMSLKQMREQANRITQVETKLLEIEAKTTTRPEYFTVMGYAILSNVKVGLALAAQIGKKAKIICQNKGYQIEKIRDPRFGQVGCYPTEVLQEVFNTITIV